MTAIHVKFSVGQIVHHKLFDYRGVVIDVDPTFQNTEDWYQQMAKSRPPKDRPWYHVLVHNAGLDTYVAERNLAPDDSGEPIRHPLLDEFFSGLEGDSYQMRSRHN